VQQEHRNQGIGRGLMLKLEELTGAHGLGRVGLTVALDEGYAVARHLYESLEYRPRP
jgi:GNAT superfamily N-acetyltransferase